MVYVLRTGACGEEMEDAPKLFDDGNRISY